MTPAAPCPIEIAAENARAAERQRVLLGGRVVYGQDFTCECTIRDLSATGARLRLPKGAVVPDAFTLIDLPHARAYGAHVVWRRDDSVGVAFDSAHDLEGPVPTDLLRIRQIWMAARFR
jgi:hypothetical protein